MRKGLILTTMMIGLMALPSGAAQAATKAESAKKSAQPAKAAPAPAPASAADPDVQPAANAPIVGNAAAGRKIYENICVHCHRLDYEASEVGAPGLRDVTNRHDVAWIEQWITSPRAFAKVDPTAKALVGMCMVTVMSAGMSDIAALMRSA